MKRVFTPAKKKTILIVDDDQLAVRIYRERLQEKGFSIEVAYPAESALATIKKGIVDLAIVDLSLPGQDMIELIKSVRSDSSTQPVPIIALSNPYLSSLTRAATEAGATTCLAKADYTPNRISELAHEFGVTAVPPAISDPTGMAEANRGKMIATFLANESEKIAKLRGSHQVFALAQDEKTRCHELVTMHRHLRALAGGAALLGFFPIARMGTALEGLLIELPDKPAKITPSVVRTIAQAIDTLSSLFKRASNSEEASPRKILVVDDEVISRETICSALGKAALEPISLDDPLAAQHLLEQDHFDLIFLDVEMPGQSGLELCVKIRAMEPNRTTPIVFVTSHSDFGSRAQSTLSGGNDFIAKPFLFVELAAKALIWLFNESAAAGHSAVQPSEASSVPEPSVPELDVANHEPTAT